MGSQGEKMRRVQTTAAPLRTRHSAKAMLVVVLAGLVAFIHIIECPAQSPAVTPVPKEGVQIAPAKQESANSKGPITTEGDDPVPVQEKRGFHLDASSCW